jgi:hypothetical protein
VITVINPIGFDPNNACVGNARQIALGLALYVQDYDEKLPTVVEMSSPEAFQIALVGDVPAKTFICPDTGMGYQPNPAIGEEVLADFIDTRSALTFEDAQAHLYNKLKTVAFLDGHIERGGVTQGDPNRLCFQNTKELALGLESYAEDYDEVLPRTNNQTNFESDIFDYTKNDYYFVCPVTKSRYIPNAAISGKLLNSFPMPSSIAVAQDSVPHPDGAMSICYLDGHATNKDYHIKVECKSNIRQLSSALVNYEQDYGETLPPTDTPADFQSSLSAYTNGNNSLFTCPDTQQPYILNSSISGDKIGSLPLNTPVLKDPSVNADGSNYTLNVDGSITTQAFYIPHSISVDSLGNASLFWFNGSKSVPSVRTFDLSPTGLASNIHTYDSPNLMINPALPPFAVAGIKGDQKVYVWGSGDPENSTPLGVVLTTSNGAIASTAQDGPYDGWTPIALANGGYLQSRILMRYYDGTCALNNLAADGTWAGTVPLIPITGEIPTAISEGRDAYTHILFSESNGGARLWTVSNQNKLTWQHSYALTSNQKMIDVTTGPDVITRMLVDDGNGVAEIWQVDSLGNVTKTSMFSEPTGWSPKQVGVDKSGNLMIFWKNNLLSAKISKYTPSGTVIYDQTYNPMP